MSLNNNDLAQIMAYISPLIDSKHKTWGVSLGIGSFITIEFGVPLEMPDENVHGEWHLWIYCASWHLLKNNEPIIGSDDDRINIEKAIKILNDLTLEKVDIHLPALDTTFLFSSGVTLRIFPISFLEGREHWMLFLPSRDVLVIGPGTSWMLEEAE